MANKKGSRKENAGAKKTVKTSTKKSGKETAKKLKKQSGPKLPQKSEQKPASKTVKKVAGKSASAIRAERRRRIRYRVLVFLGIMGGFLLVLSGVVASTWMRAEEYQEGQENYVIEMMTALAEYYEDYENEVPKLEFQTAGLKEIEEKAGQVKAKKYEEQKKEIGERIVRLREFAVLREQVQELFQDGILKSDVDIKAMDEVQKHYDEMAEGYRKALRGQIDLMRNQHQAIEDLKTLVVGMFAEEAMENVKADLSREQYNEVKAKVDSLPQRDVAEGYAEALKKVDAVLVERERIAEEERRRAEEEYRRQQAIIAAAWRTLNVPYWSQNGEGVKNGCEAASLLMALQYKGYLGGMNLRTYAEMMPKSDDPFSGFRGNIFESAKSDAPFWIAPGPLAAFGRSSSGANVVDITGSSLDALDAEVAAGNPVVIYLTLSYAAPMAWRYGAPANLHVMLLTGYNGVTGMQRVTDPLTVGGRRFYDLSRAQVESIFNATGNRAVVVR